MTAVVMKKMKPTPLILAREYPLHLPSAQGTAKYLNNAIHNLSSLSVLNELKWWKPLNFVFFPLSLSLPSDGATKIVARNVPSKSIQGYNSSQLASCARSVIAWCTRVYQAKKIKIPLNFICIFLSFLWSPLFVVTSFCEPVNYYYDRTCKWLLMRRFAALEVIKWKLKGYLTFRFPLYK